MKKIINIIIFLVLAGTSIFSQNTEPIFFNGNENFQGLFSKIEINSSGDLFIKMKESGMRFSMYIDDSKEPIISSYNKSYTAKNHLQLTARGGLCIILKKVTSSFWGLYKRQRNQFKGTLKEYVSGFKIEGNNIKWLNKDEYEKHIKPNNPIQSINSTTLALTTDFIILPSNGLVKLRFNNAPFGFYTSWDKTKVSEDQVNLRLTDDATGDEIFNLTAPNSGSFRFPEHIFTKRRTYRVTITTPTASDSATCKIQ